MELWRETALAMLDTYDLPPAIYKAARAKMLDAKTVYDAAAVIETLCIYPSKARITIQ